MTPTTVPVVGVYVKSEPMDTAANINWDAPYSEDAIPATLVLPLEPEYSKTLLSLLDQAD
jgi:hypothetical protein